MTAPKGETRKVVIVRNAVRCKKCGQVIESTHRHDYRTCKCGAVSVDGGHDYLKRAGSPDDREELAETRYA